MPNISNLVLKSSQNKKDLMTSQLPSFWCLFVAGSWEKDIQNRAAVTSLRSFLFRDEFNKYFTYNPTILLFLC